MQTRGIYCAASEWNRCKLASTSTMTMQLFRKTTGRGVTQFVQHIHIAIGSGPELQFRYEGKHSKRLVRLFQRSGMLKPFKGDKLKTSRRKAGCHGPLFYGLYGHSPSAPNIAGPNPKFSLRFIQTGDVKNLLKISVGWCLRNTIVRYIRP